MHHRLNKNKLECGEPARNPAAVKRILIVKPSSLGDIFHVFPAVARLGALFPRAEFDWLVHPAFAEALDYAPVPVARRIPFRRRELGQLGTFLSEFWELARELRKVRYDYIFDFQGLLRSAACARLAHGRVIGFARPRERAARWFYHRLVKVNLRLHAVRRNQLLVERFFHTGTMPVECVMPRVPRYAASLDAKLARLGVKPDALLIGVSPGARWESKVFPPELFGQVIRLAAQMVPDACFVLMGAPADQKLTADIQAQCSGEHVVSLAGETGLGELVELIRRCGALLANDSGPVHIAAAAHVPVVCFYGPTNPKLTGPFGDIHTIFQRGDLECIGCLKRQCALPAAECHRIDPASAALALRGKILEEQKLCVD